MARKRASRSQVTWSSRDIKDSQIVIGNNNVVTVRKASRLSAGELEELKAEFAALKQQIEAAAPSDKKDEALTKAAELQAAVLAKRPDPSHIASIRDWFVKNAPGIAGAVTGLVVNPIVGKLVEAAGDAVASEFKRRLG